MHSSLQLLSFLFIPSHNLSRQLLNLLDYCTVLSVIGALKKCFILEHTLLVQTIVQKFINFVLLMKNAIQNAIICVLHEPITVLYWAHWAEKAWKGRVYRKRRQLRESLAIYIILYLEPITMIGRRFFFDGPVQVQHI